MMQFNRRNVLKSLFAVSAFITIFKPVITWAKWNFSAFHAQSESEAITAFFPGKTLSASNSINIEVRDSVENGAVVPVTVRTSLPSVESITILAEKNPNPLIAHFDLSPNCNGYISTRIKVAEASDIIAVVQSKGLLYSNRKFVEVVEGGCS